jgi:hypothetical protein
VRRDLERIEGAMGLAGTFWLRNFSVGRVYPCSGTCVMCSSSAAPKYLLFSGHHN